MPLQVLFWHLGLLGCGWKEQRATTVFVWCGLERNLLLSGMRRLNQKILESPQRSFLFPRGFRWKLVTEMDCLRREPHPPPTHRPGNQVTLSVELWSLLRASATPQATSPNCSLSAG